MRNTRYEIRNTKGIARKVRKIFPLFVFPISCFIFSPLFAASVTPVYDLRFFGGQHFYNGDISALSGNANVLISPAVKFNDTWSVIPTYMGGYQGTRDVQELAGGGTLFQDSTNQGFTVKTIYGLTPSVKLKGTAGARAEFLRETKDENWGDGLFDYRKYTGGVETEYSYSRQIGGRFAYDFYTLDFPNYRSLESSQDSTLARELAGQDVLNSNNHLFTLSGWAPLPSAVRMELTAYYNRRDYGEQPVVDASGSLTGTDRSDTNLTAAVDFARPWALGDSVRLVSGLQVGYAATDSNQNRYDARKTVFLRDYYDYTQMSVGPQITAGLANLPWMLTASGNYSVRNYSDRPIQDANGDYLSADTEVTNITTSLGMTYALNRNFKARAVATLGWSDSNQKYEKVFVYNYKIANYLFGFSYEY